MTATKERKNKRQRGHHTHGWGAKKKHRGAGHRGGRGNAGSGKRGDAKKPTFLRDKKYMLRNKGFTSRSKPARSINLSYIDENIEQFKSAGLAIQKDDAIEIDLKMLKFDKLLSQGQITKKIIIKANSASKKAVEKVQAAGGKVVISKKKAATVEKVNKPQKSAQK